MRSSFNSDLDMEKMATRGFKIGMVIMVGWLFFVMSVITFTLWMVYHFLSIYFGS